VQNCPTCGAPVELNEADRVITCSYCDGRNYLIQQGPMRFTLPHSIPADISPSLIFYFPYLRFKGHVFSCLGKEVDHKIIDSTQLGVSSLELPNSLGLRPQAMKIQLIGGDHFGRFVQLTEKVKKIFEKAAKLSHVFSNKSGELFHRSFIGETVSFIYLPTYIRDEKLMDGVLNRPLVSSYDSSGLKGHSVTFKKEWLPRYISTVCPHCADSLECERDSLVLSCKNCDSLWYEKMGRFKRMEWFTLPAANESYHLPFWRIEADYTGVDLSNFADFLRLTNHPVVIRAEHEKINLHFWVPAFKIRPKFYLHLSKNITLSQEKLTEGKQNLPSHHHPVTLPLPEAVQSLKAVMAKSVLNKKLFLPKLPAIKTIEKKSHLVYLPFEKVGYDYIQSQTGISVNRTSLSFGRSM